MDVETRIKKMKEYFVTNPPHYWNKYGGQDNPIQMNTGDLGLTLNDTPKESNVFNGGGGCHGFAQLFMSLLHGKSLQVATVSNPNLNPDSGWEVYCNLNGSINVSLQPGDMIRMNMTTEPDGKKAITIGEGNKTKRYSQHTAVVSHIEGTGANKRVYVIQSLGDNAEINEYLFNEKSDHTPMEQNDNWIAYESTLKKCCDYVVRYVGDPVTPITVTLKDNNGKIVRTIAELPGTRFFSLPDPYNYVARKTGAEAIWRSDDGSKYENGDPTPNQSIALHVEYIPEAATVIFNATNGLPSDVTVTNPESTRKVACGKTYGFVYDPETVKFTERDLPQPTCDGYRFDGWYRNSNGTNLVDKNSPVGTSESITLYAKWTRKEVTVTFNANGGMVDPSSMQCQVGQTYTLSQPTKKGHVFDSWIDANGNEYRSSITINTESNLTLTAKWTKKKIKITFNTDGGKVDGRGEVPEVNREYGDTYDLSQPTKDGYIFNGWKDANGKEYTTSIMIDTETDLTLTAQWKRIQVEITFDANKGSCDVSKKKYNSGYTDALGHEETYDDNSSLPDARREGYTFGGWWTDIVGGDQHEEGHKVPPWNCTLHARWIVTVTFIDTVNGNTSLDVNSDGFNLPTVTRSLMCDFAGWRNTTAPYEKHDEEEQVTATPGTTFEAIWNCNVTYAPDGGTDAPDGSTVERGTSYTVGDAPKKQGYYFKGWKSSADGKTYYPGNKVTILQHTAFTALWDEMRVYITYEGEGTEHMSPQMITYADLVDGMIPTSVLSAHGSDSRNFVGWKRKDDKEENAPIYNQLDGKSLPFVNQTLVAVTSRRTRASLVFDANGGYGAPVNQIIYYDGVNVIPKEIPTHPNGLQFLSWYDVSSNADYNVKPVYSTGEAYVHKYETTLQAQWSTDFVLRYDSGIPVDDPSPVYDLPLPPTFVLPTDANGRPMNPGMYADYEMPTREGYTAIGWKYTDLGGDQHFAFPGETIDVIGACDPDDLPSTGTIVLSAVWKKNTPEQFVTVNFRDLYNDDPIEIRKVAVGGTYGTAYNTGKAVDTVFPIVGERNGSAFVGWMLDGVLIDEDTIVTKTEEHILTPLFWYLPYEDLDNNYSWAASSIYLCGYYGYMNGTSDILFSPGESVERRQVAIALYRMAGQPMTGSNKYWDVPGVSAEDDGANDTYEKVETHAISWADSCGIAKGMTEDRFEPLGNTTRLQMALFLSRYAKLYMPTLERGKTPIVEDAELTALTGEARDAVEWAASHGILTASKDYSVDPPKESYYLSSKVTRAQLAVVLIRLRDELERYKHEQVSGAQHPADDESECLDELIGDFASNSWESISKASAAGVASLCWHVGDEKDITLSNGEVVTVQIYGFDHDDLSKGGKAGITLGLKNVMRSARRMDINATNAGSFVGTELYRWLNGTLFEMLPDDLRAVIRAVDKKTSCGGSSTEYRTDSMKLFLFSESECFGRTHYSHGEEGEQYPIFTNDASRIKVLKGPEIYEWWERSPMSAYNSSFCLVHATGHAGYTSATTGYIGVSFGFCI